MKWAATLPAGDGAGLRGLYLRDNALTELPPGVFASLPRLRELELTGNGLGELPPGIFEGLDSLLFLQLDNNRLDRLRPDVFAARAVVSLRLSTNPLESLPPGVFRGLPRLGALNLGGNHLESLRLGYLRGVATPVVAPPRPEPADGSAAGDLRRSGEPSAAGSLAEL